LLKLAAAGAQQSDKTVRTTQVRSTHDDKVCLPTAKMRFKLWHPIAVSSV
jgi:hypothetical protein